MLVISKPDVMALSSGGRATIGRALADSTCGGFAGDIGCVCEDPSVCIGDMENDCQSLFMGSLPPSVKPETLSALCQAFGEVAKLDLKKGYAFVDFMSAASAAAAVALHGTIIDGKQIAVRLNTKENKRKRPLGDAAGDAAAAPPTPGAGAEGCQSVFVGGIPPGLAADQVQNLFSSYGQIANIEMKKGFAFIDYDSAACATAACVLDGYEIITGHKLGVRLNLPEHKKPGLADAAAAAKRPRPDAAQCRSVFVGGLPPETPEEDLRGAFEAFGPIARVDVKKTFAFVDFEDAAHAQAACAMDGSQWLGKTLGVRLNLQDHKKVAPPEPAIPQYFGMMAAVAPAPGLAPVVPFVPQAVAPAAVAAGASSCTVFVGGLPEDTQETELEHLFAFCGGMERLSLKKHYAFIDFASAAGAQAAVGMDGYVFKGKPIGVRVNTPEARAMFTGKTPATAPAPAPATLMPAAFAVSPFAAVGGATPTFYGGGASVAPVAAAPAIALAGGGAVGPVAGATTVFCGGLPPGATDASVKQLFGQFGAVLDVRMRKGYAFVDFATYADAQRACTLDKADNGTGRQLGVRINVDKGR